MDPEAVSFQLALEHLRQGRVGQAEALCAEILRRAPRHGDALHLAGLCALQGGQPAKSIDLIRRSLEIRPAQPMAHMNLAIALLRAGQPERALASCNNALALQPDYPDALNIRGNAWLALARPAQALADYERALGLRPQLALLHSNRGNALRGLGRTAEALASYDAALRLQPGLREALYGSAEMLRELGQADAALARCERMLTADCDDVEALQLRARLALARGEPLAALADLDRAVTLRPGSVTPLIERGNALCRLQRLNDALADFRQATRLSPGDPEVAFNEGQALLLLGRNEEALACYERVLASKPSAKAHHYRSRALRGLRRLEEALHASEQALALEPGYVTALTGKGNILYDLGYKAAAADIWGQALRIEPDAAEALSHRARALLLLGQPEEAIRCVEHRRATAAADDPEQMKTLSLLLHARLTACDWREYDELLAALEAGIERAEYLTPPSVYTASAFTPATQLRCSRRYADENWGALARAADRPACHGHDRVRIAYLSADYCQHPVSQLMASIFELHDRARFETIGIATQPQDDSALARRVARAFDRFLDVSRMDEATVAARLRELEVDICIDLTGYTTLAAGGSLARRCAPVQVNYLGYPATLGADYMDYILADATVIPPQERVFYSEKVAWLPHCYLPPGDAREIPGGTQGRGDHGLPERGFVFCAFNNHGKIVPPVFDAWMRLLREVDGSVLWLSMGSDAVVRNLRAEAARRGIDPARLVFAPRLPALEDHLARHRLADLFLDTLPYNAHTTARDALGAGLPVLTCRGATFPGRVAASLLNALELPELITSSLEAYAERALELARAPDALARLRSRLAAARNAHPVFDPRAHCRHLEAAYQLMIGRARRGEPPEHFLVEP